MQHIQKRSKRISRNLPNLRLIHQRLIKQTSSILLLNFTPIHTLLLTILIFLLLRHGPGDIKPHFHKLIFRRPRLAPSTPRPPQVPIRSCLGAAYW